MTGFEYALALLSVLIGLTLSEIATDFHRLVRNAGTVRWDGRVLLNIVEKWKDAKRPRIWVDMGTEEGNAPQAMIQDARALREALVRKGWAEGADLMYREIRGAGHNESAWGARFGQVLEYLFHD